jgi:hypothetical protein
MQKNKIQITNQKAALTLRNSNILHYFLEPISPSAVAKKAGLAANLVHHYAKNALALGLLLEVKREKRQVFYQLAAQTFTYTRDLISVEHRETQDMKLLSEAFLAAYARSDALHHDNDPEYHIHGFGSSAKPNPKLEPYMPKNLEKYPAHFQVRTLRLGQQEYQQLIQDISSLIAAASFRATAEASACSIAVLGFDGVWHEGHEDSDNTNSYVPLSKLA